MAEIALVVATEVNWPPFLMAYRYMVGVDIQLAISIANSLSFGLKWDGRYRM